MMFQMRVLRPTGNYQKKEATKNFLLTCLGTAITLIIIFTSIPNLPTYLDVGNFQVVRGTFSLIPFIIGIIYWRKYKKYKLGYEGENLVTEILKSSFSDDCFLINDITLHNRGNIDHIVLSPNGIFVIETKNHRGKITCYGDEWLIRYRGKNKGSTEREFNFTLGSPSAQVRNNAFRVKKVIELIEPLKSKRVWVQGIVVFPNKDAELFRNELPEYVEVLTLYELPNYLKNYSGKEFSFDELELVGKEIIRQAKN
jgi:hypothetical protein